MIENTQAKNWQDLADQDHHSKAEKTKDDIKQNQIGKLTMAQMMN